jgi:hypothetical protein
MLCQVLFLRFHLATASCLAFAGSEFVAHTEAQQSGINPRDRVQEIFQHTAFPFGVFSPALIAKCPQNGHGSNSPDPRQMSISAFVVIRLAPGRNSYEEPSASLFFVCGLFMGFSWF